MADKPVKKTNLKVNSSTSTGRPASSRSGSVSRPNAGNARTSTAGAGAGRGAAGAGAGSGVTATGRTRGTSAAGQRKRETAADGRRTRETAADGRRTRETAADGRRIRETAARGANSRRSAETIERKRNANEQYYEEEREPGIFGDSIADEIIIILSLLFSILLILSCFDLCGTFGNMLNNCVFGLFGRFGYVFPIALFVIIVFAISNKSNRSVIGKIICCVALLFMICAMTQLIAGEYNAELKPVDYFDHSIPGYEGPDETYGGFFGGLIYILLYPLAGGAGTACILVAGILVMLVLICGKTIITSLTRKGIENVNEHRARKNFPVEDDIDPEYDEASDYDENLLSDEEYQAEEYETNRRKGRAQLSSARNRRDWSDVDEDLENMENLVDSMAAKKKEKPQEGFIDRLMRTGMGLDTIGDIPEYKDVQREFNEASKRTMNPANADNVNQPDELKDFGTVHYMDENGTDLSVEKVATDLEKTGADSESFISASDKLIEQQLKNKFANKSGIDIPNLREHPTMNTRGLTRINMEDSDEPELPENVQDTRDISNSGNTGSISNTGTAGNISDTGNTGGTAAGALTGKACDMQAFENENRYETAGEVQSSEAIHSFPGADKQYNSQINGNYEANTGKQDSDDEDNAGIYDIRKKLHVIKASNMSSNDNFGDNGTDDVKASQKAEKNAASKLEEHASSGAACFTDLSKAYEEKPQEPLPYVFPPISLLSKSNAGPKSNSETMELKETVETLQRTFKSFGVNVKVTDATCGPTVTRYEILPDQGVKVKTITSLSDDIKLALAAAEIRIEAPIPGKAAVGIEVPNKKTSPVLFGDLIDSTEFSNAHSNLTFAVGKDIGGKTICSDIAGMPHMLIAGATGSGKSVCINALIMSILYKAKPTDVKMIMIDPKRVELVGYNGIPHLLVPVVTDVKKASGVLNWAISEMDDRYAKFADNGVNNLASYNRVVEERYYEEGNEGECPDRLPQILLIVDELNDLMMTANSKEIEAAICRLTQLARASGIHVVLATQRPSVNVITGTIKANIPSRIAFSVSSVVDSRTIIDQSGAEKLLGKGDMLFYPQGYPKPVRLQGAYVSDTEVAEVVKFIKENSKAVKYSESVSRHIDENSSGDSKNGSSQSSKENALQDDRDELFAEAGRLIIEKGKASIGSLQRVYKIGFNRAARIMDQLAREGIVGPEEGTKPRRILMNTAQFDAYLNGETADDMQGEDDSPADSDADFDAN